MKSIKGKKTIIPAKPDIFQKYLYDHHIDMNRCWFDAIMKGHARFVEDQTVCQEDKDGKSHSASVYAIDALRSDSERKDEPSVYCFFIHYDRYDMLWKAFGTDGVTDLINALKTVGEWDEYEGRKRMEGYKRKELLKEKKQKSRKKAA